jgi:hypothetical protein
MTGIRLEPDAYYSEAEFLKHSGFAPTALEQGRRSGDLRFVKRGHARVYKGSWLISWLSPTPTNARQLAGVAG